MGAPYQSQSVSGFNASPPPDDGTTVAANKITWNSTIKAKLADPLNTFIAAVNSQLVTWSDFSSVTTSTNLTTTTAHHMQTIEVTSGSPTIQLGDAATMTKNYVVTVTNTGTGAPVIALATAGNTLDGTAAGTFTFPTGTKTSFTFKVNNGATGYYTEAIGGKSPYVYGSLTATTSLITPLLVTGGSVDLVVGTGSTVGGGQQFTISASTGNFTPIFDNTQSWGSSSKRLQSVVTSAVDSGAAGTLSLRTNSGTVGLQILDVSSGARNVTIASSAAGNPTISTTAGNLAITPSVVCASTLSATDITGSSTLQAGSTPGGTGSVRITYNTFVSSADNSGVLNVPLVGAATVNSVTNIIRVGIGGTSAGAGVLLFTRSGAGVPTTSDIPASNWCLWRDTSGATTKLYYNNAGSLQSVALV